MRSPEVRAVELDDDDDGKGSLISNRLFSRTAFLLSTWNATMKRILLFSFLLGSFAGGQDSSTCPEGDDSCHPEPTWNLLDDHPCNIDILSLEDFSSTFPQGFPMIYDKPFILRDSERNRLFQELTERQNVASLFAGDTVKLPFADLYSFATNEVNVEDYINLPETTSWDEAGKSLYMLTSLDDFSNYTPPPGLAEISDTRIGIGALGSGVQWHSHGPGFCETMQGRKHWLLTEPDNKPAYDMKRPSRHWLEYFYATYQEKHIWECTVEPGDAIYFPNMWWHTTVNLDAYTAFVSIFYDISNKNSRKES